MRRTLYWKRLLIVAAAFFALGGAAFAVHRVQLRSQVNVYKGAAERAEAGIDGDAAKRGEVIDLYAKYLRFRPSDEAAYQRYAGLLFEQTAADPEPASAARTTAGVEGFLRAFPAHTDERRRLAELYTKGGRFMNARQHVDMLFAAPGGAFKTDIEVLELAAACEQGMGDLPKAIEYLDAAVKTGRAPVRVYKRALELNYANKTDPRRNTNVAALLEALLRNPRFVADLSARVAAGRFQLFIGEIQNAGDSIEYARTGIPGGADDPDTLLASAEVEVAGLRPQVDPVPKLARAAEYLRRARARDPKNIAVGTLLCEVLSRQGKRDEGVEALRATAKLLAPTDPDYAMVADRLIDLGERTESAAMTDVIAAHEGHKVLVPYFRGRLAVLAQDWAAALRLLDEARPTVARVPAFHKKALVGLAACYAAMQNPDQQLEFCRRARAIDPGYPLAVIGEAEALGKMGKIREALDLYRRIVNDYQLPEYRPELARLELLAVLTGPAGADARDWARFDESVGKGPVADRPVELQVLYADSLFARNRGAEAVKALREWIDANPKNPKAGAAFVALSRIGTRGAAESALAILDEARSKVGNSVDLCLARATLLVARNQVPEPADFDALAAGSDGFLKSDQFRLWFGLGQAAGQVADMQPNNENGKKLRAAALKYLRTAADLVPSDLTCRAALLDHGLASGRMDVVAQVLKEIAAVEGPAGPVGALGRIAIELPEVRTLTDPARRAAAVKRLRELGRMVRESRPRWGRVYVALAELDLIEGLNDAALANYKLALDNGDRQEFVIRRAVELYRTRKQDDKAVALLNALRTEVPLPEDLDRYRAIRDLLGAPEVPKNSRLTVDGIAPADSKDYRMQLLRGSLLATIRADDASLEAFRRAVALNARSPETWASLVAQLVRVNKVEDAKEAVAQAGTALGRVQPAAPEARAELEIARGGLHEMVGATAAALAHYEAAVAAAPGELNPVRQLVLFHQRAGQGRRADELLAAAKDAPAPDVARWARRHLALTLIAGPNAYNARARALELVERNLAAAGDDPEDVKARAVVWTVDPATREEGVRVLKSFGDRGDLTPDEFYLLGRLAFDVGRFPEAEEHFKRAAQIRPGVTAEHIAALVRVQIALAPLNQFGRADAALERLKINNPGSWEAVREEARLLYRKSRDRAAVADPAEAKKLLDAARALVQKFPGGDAPAAVAYRTGPLLEELGLTAEAETAYRKYLADGGVPGDLGAPAPHAPLAILYVRQKQTQRAIDLAFEREPKAPTLLTARLLTGAVRAARPDAAAEGKIEKWLDAALARAAADPELEAALIGAKAELADARADYATAIREYERSVATYDKVRDPKTRKDVVVNNLCMLLALHQPARADEAARMMSDLIAIRGPVPAFLDTRAVAYLVSSRPEQAIKDLRMALVQYDRATYHFHLAWALDLNVLEEQRLNVDKELSRARDMGLAADDLHPIEFEKYKSLLSKYSLKPK